MVGADTIVALGNEVMGKPGSEREAVSMLERLRGRTHRVYTAVCAVDAASGRSVAGGAATAVRMREYSDAEIRDYAASGEPMDKAGGYGVQDREFRPAGSVDGCYLNVVGLPLCVTVGLLGELGAAVRLLPGRRPPDGCRPCSLPQSGEAGGPAPRRPAESGAAR